ncbi:hypothetical protein R6Q59_032121 [Mikania micrantha]|uniref:Uncharacterized protein n=1 Tax=Mikania micrantha TaxID=192012 RepID=A0A5N6NRE2_9ASTR|nr:hypothetical protein E3N88_16845 [Mikania micrantha]
MSGLEQFAVSRTNGGDHIGFDSNFDSDLNQVFQQGLLRVNNHLHQLHGMAVTDVDNRTDAGYRNGALSVPTFPSSSCLPGPSRQSNYVTNLDSFLDSVTPIVPARKSLETDLNGQASREAEIHPYYCIGDLWESFQEWSAYGAGVPFLLDGIHRTTQYYVPYLSGIQLYIDPKNSPMTIRCLAEKEDVWCHDPDQQTNLLANGSSASLKMNSKMQQVLLRDDKTEVCGSRGMLAFEFMERERPHTRKTLSDKASVLGSQFPELNNYRSCDISTSSWICVAWYPIYRIPVGPTLEDLEASFLTLHSLSTQPGSYNEAESYNRNTHGIHGELDLSSTVRLPVFGLASYKLKGSIISPRDLQERERENALLMAASNWLQNLQALLPDYHFFVNRYSP